MTKTLKQKEKIHQALYDFILFSDTRIPILIDNVLLLKEYVPQDIKNPILLFLLPHAINGLLENLILEVEQAWRILNKELEALNEQPLDINDQDYRDLDRMRDKLIGHRIEVSLANNQYNKWYIQKYGSYEKTFDLIKKVANKIRIKIEHLNEKDKLFIDSGSIRLPEKIKTEDIKKLLDVLKSAGIY